jgi:HAD superfamily hydrolase (TIGR01509 family)
MMYIHVAFFDLGGTLVEIKEELYEDFAHHISSSFGFPCTGRELQWVQTKRQEQRYLESFYWSVLRDRLGIPDPKSRLTSQLAEMSMTPKSFTCFPDVSNTLEQLDQAGIRLGLISNAFPSARGILEHLNLTRWFEWTILSYEKKTSKPDCGIYRDALKSADAQAEEVLFVDDRPEFVRGAERVGFRYAILIDRDHQPGEWKGSSIHSLKEVDSFVAPFASQVDRYPSRDASQSCTMGSVARRRNIR